MIRRSSHGSRVRRAGLTLLLALPLSGATASEPAASFRLPVEEVTLANGMRLLLVPRPGAVVLAAGWAVGAGSGDEPAGRSGVAHLVEHLLHQGTSRVSASDYARLYTEAGAVGIDARTDRDLTAYFLRLPANQLELWFWLESDRLREPTFGGLERELQVLAEERRQRLESTPSGPIDEELQRLLWGDHPYAQPVGGAAEALGGLRRSDAEAFFATRYGAAELTAVLVGDFSAPRARALAERYFAPLPPHRAGGAPTTGGGGGEAPRATAIAAPPVGGGAHGGAQGAAAEPAPPGERTVDRSCACPAQARVLYRTVPGGHPDRVALDVLAGVLAGRTGRLHRSLVVQRGLAFSAGAWHEARRQGGAFTVELEARGETAPEALVAAWDAELARLLASPPDDQELQRVRNQVTTAAWRGMREPLDLALRLLAADAQGDWRALESWPAAVLETDGAAVQRVARRYLRPEQRLVARLRRAEQR